MATDLTFVQSICDQAGRGLALSYRKMFGEYALYLDGKTVALCCDNQLFVKPTDAGRALLGSVAGQAPFPGAKLWFRLDDEIDDRHLLQRLLRVTADALPLPLPKPKPKPKPKLKAPAVPAR